MKTSDLGIFKGRSAAYCDKLFYFLLAAFTFFHLLILLTAPVDLASDESLYWEYSKHLDWSFFAKGPGIGMATWISTYIFGDTVFAVRIVGLFCFTVFSAMLYYFVKHIYSAACALAGFIFVRVTILFIYTGLITTTDPVVIPFWLGAMTLSYFAVSRNNPKYWIFALPMVAFGILAKYTAAILIPGFVAVLFFHRSLQHHLKSTAWWLGCALFMICISPIFIWNAQNDWTNVKHNLGHTVGKADSISKHVLFYNLPELIAGQLGLIGPVFLPLLCIAIWKGIKRWRSEFDPVLGLWLGTTVPLLIVCIIVSATRSCYANWPLPAYIGGLLLVIHEYKNLGKESWFRRSLISNAIITLPLQICWYLPLILPVTMSLPTPIKKIVGWTELGNQIENYVYSHSSEQDKLVVFATDYMTASSLRFSVSPDIEVVLGSFAGRRLAEQDFWQNWPDYVGKDCLVVQKKESDLVSQMVPGWFEECHEVEMENLPPPNRLAKDFGFWLCKNFTGKRPVAKGAW